MNFNKPDNKIWHVRHRDFYGKLSLHAEGRDYTPESKGIWNSYIFIPERLTPTGLFSKIWLEDKIIRLNEQSPARITHDYMSCGYLTDIPLHGGLTYYAKHGHTIGHRSVKVGCDWNHLWDMESCFADIEEVKLDLTTAIDHWLDVIVPPFK